MGHAMLKRITHREGVEGKERVRGFGLVVVGERGERRDPHPQGGRGEGRGFGGCGFDCASRSL